MITLGAVRLKRVVASFDYLLWKTVEGNIACFRVSSLHGDDRLPGPRGRSRRPVFGKTILGITRRLHGFPGCSHRKGVLTVELIFMMFYDENVRFRFAYHLCQARGVGGAVPAFRRHGLIGGETEIDVWQKQHFVHTANPGCFQCFAAADLAQFGPAAAGNQVSALLSSGEEDESYIKPVSGQSAEKGRVFVVGVAGDHRDSDPVTGIRKTGGR